MKLLFASSFLPFPGTRFGGAHRLYNLARALGERHDVSVIALDGCLERARWDGAPPFEKFLLLDPGPGNDPAMRLTKLAHSLDASRLLRARGTALEAFLDPPYDCAVLGYPLAANLLRLPAVAASRRVAYIDGDLHIEQADARRRDARGVARLFRELRFRQTDRFYRDFLERVDDAYLSTEIERERLARRYPGTSVRPLGHGIDPAEIPFLGPPTRDGTVGFIGNFRHAPNADALRWYLRDVHPVLRERHPGYRFLVAGADLDPDLAAALDADPFARRLGAVESLADFYREISFLANPIVSGRGIRTKVIEAAAYGRAVVSTPLGADGTEPLEVDLAETPAEFAEACSRRILAPRDAREANRRMMERVFSTRAVAEQLLGEA